jgi:lysophospholipase L1-like esterase
MQRSAFLAGLGAAPLVAATGAGPLRILVLGDSLALATGASRADGGFIFPAFRRLLLEHPGSELDNVAIGGSTVADVLRLQAPRVAASDPDVTIVCVGANDVVRGTPPGAFARTYHALLAAIARAAPRARLICCGVPDIAASPLFSDEPALVARRSAADDAAVRAAARAAGARHVDFFTITARHIGHDEQFFSRDRFHPSDAGYALLRAALLPALKAAAGRFVL